VLRAADVIHVATRAHVERSDVLQPFIDKVRVIPYLVDLRRVTASRDHPLAARVRAFAAGSTVVLAVGRLVYYKGMDVLLEALAATTGPRLVIVGDGPLRPRLNAIAERLGVAGRVLWLGTLSDDDLAAAYYASQVFVLPSVAPSEAFGIVQVEAMAAGLPVVSTKLGTGVEEVNRDGETGITVRPSNTGELASAITRLVDDLALRQRFGAQAREHAQGFSPERLLVRYRDLYAAVSDRKG
jgi:rhamnosyl/mannosyltransferase